MEWWKKQTKSMHNSFREKEQRKEENRRNNPLNKRKQTGKRIWKQLEGQLGAPVASKEIAEVGLEDLLLEPEVKT